MKKVVLAIGAHPDDIEFGCGGTLSLFRERGHELHFLIVTSGEEGNFNYTKFELKELREKEAREASEELGAVSLVNPMA